jgi:hypothetical protein
MPPPPHLVPKRSKFSKTFASALTYVTLTLTLPNALFTFLAFPELVGRFQGSGFAHPHEALHTELTACIKHACARPPWGLLG